MPQQLKWSFNSVLVSKAPLSLKVQILSCGDRFAAIADQWDSLWARSGVALPTARSAFVRLWCEHFARCEQLRVVTVYSGGQLVAGLPLVGRTWNKLYRWGALPSNHWAQHGSLLVDRKIDGKQVAAKIARALSQLPWTVVAFPRIALHDANWQALIQACHGLYPHSLQTHLYSGARLRLDRSWSELQRSWSRNRRRHVRRIMQRAQRTGDFELEVFERVAPEEVEHLLHEGFEIEHRSWKGDEGTSVLGADNIYPFFLEQSRHIAEMNCLRLAFLNLDGKRIAFEYSWQAGSHLFQAKVGYDASYAHISPGRLLEYLHLQDIHDDHRIAFVDFLGPRNDARQSCVNDRYPIGSFLVATRGLSGQAFLAAYRLRREWRRVRSSG